MSSDLAPRNDPTLQPVPPSLPPPVPPDRSGQDPHRYRQRKGKKASTLHSYGEPMVWLTGGALGVALFMILGLLLLVVWQGVVTFWPEPVVKITTANGDTAMGQVIRSESFRPDPTFLRALTTKDRARAETAVAAHEGELERRLVRIGNFRITGEHFAWVDGFQVAEETKPHWAVLVERQAWGRFYGIPAKFLLDGQAVADTPETIWAKFHEHHGEVRDRREQRKSIEQEMGLVHARLEEARLSLRGVELRHTRGSDAWRAAEAENRKREVDSQRQFQALEKERKLLDQENDRYAIAFRTFHRDQVVEAEVKLVDIVRAFPANQLTVTGKLGLYFSRWFEFLFDEPREANSEGGVWPAIFGTVVMTLIMCIFVVPFGVLAALYLREYARAGFIVSAVRIAINNLAGVPSIVFGVFGLGFFCYIIGASLDDLMFEARLPNPTYGKGGVLWASLTLALLDPAGGHRGHGGGAGRRARVHAGGFVCLRGEQVADHPADRVAPRHARHHDRHDSGHGPRCGRGGSAHAGGRGQAGPGPARGQRVPLSASRAQLHAPRVSHIRPRIPEPEQRGGQAHGVHHHAAADRDRGRIEPGRDRAPGPAAPEVRDRAVLSDSCQGNGPVYRLAMFRPVPYAGGT